MKNDDLLLTVYIGQEINFSRGVLYKFKDQSRFDENDNKIIDSLLDSKLVKENQPYTSLKSIVTLVTTKDGKDKARTLIQGTLQSHSTLLEELGEIPKKALGFLMVNMNSRIFEQFRQEWFRDWKDFVLYKTKMFDFSLRFCQILGKHNLAVLTDDYVSSHGGRIDPRKYVFPDEVKDYLTKTLNPNPFDYEETNQSILFYTLYKIKKEILPIKDEGKRRNNYWNLLRVLPFDESTIKSLISQFKEENITTEYSEIENEQFLFAIHDGARFDIKLDRMVEEFISRIVEGERTEPRVLLPKPSEALRMHSELFGMIGNFEMRFREHLINEMRPIFKEDKNEWYDQLKEIKLIENQSPFNTLYDKLEARRNEDLKNKILPEDELIYYADITDYKDIILKNWKVFESRFRRTELSKEKFEHGMNELNKIRRKVMHLRDITPSEAKTLRLYIIPCLEKIFT
jgi:hypothetical protein